jgi:aspartyl protease family protein
MSNDPGPWGHQEPDKPPPPASRQRLLVWLGFAAAVAGGIWLLFKAFPGAVMSREDWSWLAYLIGLLVLLSVRVVTARRVDWGQKARHATIWIGIAGVLIVVAAYRDELAGVGQRVRSELSGSYPVAAGAHELVVTQESQGGFFVMGRVNGQPVRFLIDTGSSDTVLSPADAHRLGLDAGGLQFNRTAETANGIGYGAQITADSLAVRSIELTHLPMVINQAPMSSSLLGMSFLGRLESFQVRGRKLYLKGRG